jgi:putative tryptophan/tyrosine transport system substrate-binding protein
MIKRREFIAGLGGAAAWPMAARAQHGERIRRIGALMSGAADGPTSGIVAFRQGLQELGWIESRNLRIDIRRAGGNAELYRKYATELVALAPEVILAVGGSTAAALQQASRSTPIVFVLVTDPVAFGLVASLARPGGNATGFTIFDYSFSAKWVELLKKIAPHVTRVAVMRDPAITTGIGQFAAMQSMAASLGIELTAFVVRGADEIEQSITTFARTPNGGLIVPALTQGLVHRDLIISLAARHQLPAVYPYRSFVTGGGLISYGFGDSSSQYRLAASYVDRILKGEKPADLPVQAPTKYETVINLKTAKALGLTIPETLLATADEVIQ